MDNTRTRLNNRISSEIVNAGYFDNRTPRTNFEYNIFGRNIFSLSSQRWRIAYLFDEGVRDVLNSGVPMWFLKRYKKFIVNHFIWEKQSRYGWDYGGIMDIDIEDLLSDFSIRRDNIVKSMDINIIKHFNQKGFINSKMIDCTDRMGIVSADIITFWRVMRDRFISIHGRDCKMCKTKKHDNDIICHNLDKYRLHICNDCLKKFCKLDDMAKSIIIKN